MNASSDAVPRVARWPAIPELLYDGQCSICSRWAVRWARVVGPRIRLRPLEQAETQYPEIREQLRQAIHLVEPDGRVRRGAEAILRSLALGRGLRAPLWMYLHCAVTRFALDRLYQWAAAHRCAVPDSAHASRARTKTK
jgi:predicted DCC family thiol-disulfide oxidoreductase YuxK